MGDGIHRVMGYAKVMGTQGDGVQRDDRVVQRVVGYTGDFGHKGVMGYRRVMGFRGVVGSEGS